MDPFTGVAIAGAGYFILRRDVALRPEDTQPESRGPKPQTSKAPLPPAIPDKVPGKGDLMQFGQDVGALVGQAANALFLEATAGYDAPLTKQIGGVVLVGASAIGAAIVVVVAIQIGFVSAGYVGLIVIAVLAIVFAFLVIAANIEDVNRWNAFVSMKQMVVKAVAAGRFKEAMAIANSGGQQGIPGLGFYVSETQLGRPIMYHKDTLYYKTAFDVTPKIPGAGGYGLVNRGGLDRDYTFPTVTQYEYKSYFGKDFANILILGNGAPFDVIPFLESMRDAQNSAYRQLALKTIAAHGRIPTYEEWITHSDIIKDQNGTSIRQWIQMHDDFGAKIAPAFPWLDTYLLQSIEFQFHWESTERDGRKFVPHRKSVSQEKIDEAYAGENIQNLVQKTAAVNNTTSTNTSTTHTGQKKNPSQREH